MTNLLQAAGGVPNRQPKFVPLFMDRAFTGLYTQRNPLHDASDLATTRFYGGRPDALLDGLNIELTNRLTLQRRPGLSNFSTVLYPTIPNIAFSFEGVDNLHRVMIDTGSTGSLTVTSADVTNGTTTVYHGTFPDGGTSAYVGMLFTIAGFANPQNNGTFEVTASTTTTLTLANTQGIAEILAATAVSSGGVYWDKQTGGLKQLLFGKAAGAGQTYFIGVAGVLYMGDGVEVKKYTPDNPNGEIWRWGIVAPTVKPGTQVVTAGSAAVQWQAHTWFSTMGLLLDSNSNLQMLTSVNADGTNPNSVFGTSSGGGPPWNHIIGQLTTEGGGSTVTWRTMGWLNPWTANTTYSDYGFQLPTGIPFSNTIFDVPTNSVYNMTSLSNFDTSGLNKPAFNGIAGSGVPFNGGDPTSQWICKGPGLMPLWSGSTVYANGDQISEYPLPPLPGQTSLAFIHACVTPGTSAASYATVPWQTTVGAVTVDKQLAWTCMGQAAWQSSHSYTAWVGPQDTSFSAIVDVNSNIQVCITGGISGLVDPGAAWQTAYGSQTMDGTVLWSCAGPSSTWIASRPYCLPGVGFSPKTATNAYGGVNISDSNNNEEWVIATGFSGTPTHPVWATAQGDTTNDAATLVWVNNGATPSHSFTWFKSLQYVYSYKARTANDPYNTTAPPLWPNPLGPYKGSGTGVVSSASPLTAIPTGSVSSAVVNLTLTGSLDPQVDTIEIYRTTDGGSTFLFLTDIPNPAPSGGNPGVVTLQDYMPDTPTTTLPGLNALIQAPINGVNDPPDDAYLPMAFSFQRIWGAAPPSDQVLNNTSVFFSGGPDTLVGNPNEAFAAADTFPFLSTVIRVVKSTKGLVTFLNDSIELITGGPTTASFFSVTLAPGIGLRNYNALDVYAGEIFFFAADGRMDVMSPELQLAEFGFPIADKLVQFDPAAVHVAVFQVGLDACIFIADGSTGWYRVNPRQIPGGFSGPEPVWSPFAAITNGCKFLSAIEVSSGVKKLLVGPNATSQTIRERNLSVFTDVGTQYDAYFVMGSLMLANPGQIALLKFLEMDFSGVSYQPTVGFLLNEISGSFTNFTQIPTFDPPQIYGKTITPTSYSPNRYYFTAEEALARCRHMQIKIDFGTTAVGDEMYNLTIFGRFVMEP